MNFSLHLPLGIVSFGQLSVCLLREFHKRGLQPSIFSNGPIDLSSQNNIDADFSAWIQSNVNKSLTYHKKTHPCFKLWHFVGSLESFSHKQILLTFLETDSPTPAEINTVKNNDLTLFTSNYTLNLFKDFGCTNIGYLPLGFDSHNFSRLDKQYFTDGRIVFNMVGKWEHRKNHRRALRAWAKKYGNNPKFFLQAAVYNQFLSVEDNQKFIAEALEGKEYFNIQVLKFMDHNALYNDYLNSGDIVIAAGNECWGVGEFQSVAIGKHAVVMGCNGYLGWANDQNSVIFSPSEKIEAYDGIFFAKGQPYSQGNFYSFQDDPFLDACDKAIQRVEKNRVNEAGLKLQQDFTWSKTVDVILAELEKLS